jgi:hypothetical protein
LSNIGSVQRMRVHISVVALLCSIVVACHLLPETVTGDDPRVKAMFEAMAKVDRKAFGFTPVSRDASIRLERGPRSGYDATLHVDGKTSRTVAFRSVGSGYEWIGEQEDFESPRVYQTVDGEVHESITLSYEKVPIWGFPINELSVSYHGEDPVLAQARQLSLEAVRPTLNKWGY